MIDLVIIRGLFIAVLGCAAFYFHPLGLQGPWGGLIGVLAGAMALGSCASKPAVTVDREVTTLGTAEVSAKLLEAAKRRAHVTSDTELIELALSRRALEDDFGPRLLRLKGSVPADIDFGI